MLPPAISSLPQTVSEPPREGTELRSLVTHREWVPADMPLAEVQTRFQHSTEDFFAIIKDTQVIGLCSRANIGFMLGSRYGFSLYGSSPVTLAKAPRPLMVRPNTPHPDVLDTVLSRTGAEFFEDVILIEEDGRLIGLMPVPRLARLQSQLFGIQLARAARQDTELRQQNLDLFQINHQLRQSQGRYKALFENDALGVALVDSEGSLLDYNCRLAELLQFDDNAAVTHNLVSWLMSPDRERLLATLHELEHTAQRSVPVASEFTFEFPGGPKRFELHLSWVTETGQICAFLDDVTQQRQLEKQLAQREKQNLLDTLAAGVAHELNNKLTPVLGFADLLHRRVPAELRRHTECIQTSAQEAAAIIRQLLNLSKPTAARRELVDVRIVITEAAAMLRYQFREARCALHWTPPAETARINGDSVQLKQILINLMLNALHAMEHHPTPVVKITLEVNDRLVSISVQDHGIGIPTDNISRIFDPFFTTKGPKGTGLGLSISASIARQHDGEISVMSTVNQGSVFTLQLPVAVPANAPLLFASEDGSPLAIRNEPTPSVRVLVVDDEEFVRQFLQEALRVCFGCQVDIADDGSSAIIAIREKRYDLVLSDIRMPRINGFELRNWVQQNQPELAKRFIFVTGHAGEVNIDHGLDSMPPCPVIRKPFTMETIRAACEPFLQAASR